MRDEIDSEGVNPKEMCVLPTAGDRVSGHSDLPTAGGVVTESEGTLPTVGGGSQVSVHGLPAAGGGANVSNVTLGGGFQVSLPTVGGGASMSNVSVPTDCRRCKCVFRNGAAGCCPRTRYSSVSCG